MNTDLSSSSSKFTFDGTTKPLRKKYFGFYYPFTEIKVDGTDINTFKCVVNKVEIELNNSFSSSAVFELVGVFDLKESKYADNAVKKLMPGKPVAISLGYLSSSGGASVDKEMELVFSGYILTVSYNMRAQTGHGIRVECADVRCAMMNGRYYQGATEKTLLLTAKSILEKADYKKFYKTLTMEKPPQAEEKDFEIQLTSESDYDFIIRTAKKLGYEFLMIQDTLIFRKNRGDNADPMITLGPGEGVFDINFRRTLGGMLKEVEVLNADDEKGETIKGSAKSSAKWSSDTSANNIVKDVKRVIIDPSVKTNDEAKTRAGSELDSVIWNFGVLTAICVGMPELVPGRFIKIDKVAKNAIDGSYYISRVKHVMESGKGFKTILEANTNTI